MSDLHDVVIVSAVRTPIGRLGGALSSVRPDDLAALVIAEAVSRAGVPPAEIEEVFMGCANQAGEDNRDVARMAAAPRRSARSTWAGVTVNRLCASGLTAVNQAARAIRCGEGDDLRRGRRGEHDPRALLPAQEPRSRSGPPATSPPGTPRSAGAIRTRAWRRCSRWRPWARPRRTSSERAERAASPAGPITREEQDRFALQSHARAVRAINAGYFKDEIVPVPIPQREGRSHPRRHRRAPALPPDRRSGYRAGHQPRAARQAAAGLPQGRDGHRRQLQRHERRRRRRWC